MKNEQAALALENEMKAHRTRGIREDQSLYQDEIARFADRWRLSRRRGKHWDAVNQLRAMAAKVSRFLRQVASSDRLPKFSNEQMSAETAIVRANENITSAEHIMNQLQQERDRLTQ